MVKPITLNEQLCFAIYKAQKQYNHFYSQALAPVQVNLSAVHHVIVAI